MSEEENFRLSGLDTIGHLTRLRGRYEQHGLDAVAWELLLELLRAERSERRLSVSALAVSVHGTSTTTMLRRVAELQARGYLARTPDSRDRRRSFVELTEMARELLVDYLARVDDCLAI
ncbi:MAG TPA: MarR family transcriptional regulator [Steroidobacteraceae bacterium]